MADLSPSEELELIQIEQEQRARAKAKGPAAPAPSQPSLSQMNFTPDTENPDWTGPSGAFKPLTEATKEAIPEAVQDLPYVGAAVGSVGAGIPGAAIGGAIGQEATNAINMAFMPERAPSTVEAFAAPVIGAAKGVGSELLGRGAGKLVSTAGSLVGMVSEGMGKASTKIAQRFLGFRANDVAKVGGREEAANLVKVLQEEGLFKNGASPDAVASRLDDIAKEAGQKIGAVYDGPIGDLPIVNGNDLKDAIAVTVRGGLERSAEIQPAKLAQLDALDEMISRRMGPTGEFTGRQIHELQQDLGAKAFEKGVVNENLSAYQDAWKVLKAQIDTGLKRVGRDALKAVEVPGMTPATDLAAEMVAYPNQTAASIGEEFVAGAKNAADPLAAIPKQVAELQRANQIYHASLEAGKRLEEKLARGEAQGSLRLGTRLVAGGAGAIAGGPVGSTVGLVAEEAANRYGAQAGMTALKKGSSLLSTLVRKSPKSLGKYAPALANAAARGSLAVYNHQLMQTDQKYREMMKKLQEKEGK